MGSNVHIQARQPWRGLKPFPEELTGKPNCCTIFRYQDGYAFMKAVWDQDCVFVSRCGCDPNNHGYGCDTDSICRPRDLQALRLATKDLEPVWQILIDYLESEPNAYLEYD